MAYLVSVHKASAVRSAVKANFFAPDESSLIVAYVACPSIEKNSVNVASAKQIGRKYMPSRLSALSCEPPSQCSAPYLAYSLYGWQVQPPTTSSLPPTTTATSPCPGTGSGARSAMSALPKTSPTGSFAMLLGDLGFWPTRRGA